MSFYCTYFTRWLLIKDFLNANKTYTYISIQNLSNLYTNHFPNKVNNENGNKPITKKKKIFSPKISLYIDDKLTVTTLQEAEKLANRRDFKLMQLDKACSSSSSSGRLVYKLLSKSQLAASGKKPGKAHKGEKELALTAKIGRHDIDSKIKNISKWLSKNLEVKVVVSGEPDLAEEVYKLIETGISDSGRLVQKRQKAKEMRFQILPPKKEKQSTENNQEK